MLFYVDANDSLMALCFDPDDIHWHSGAGQPVRHWHALAHPESGQELCRWFELNVLCHLTALLPESDLAEHLLPSARPEHGHPPRLWNQARHSVMITGDVIMSHCLWDIYVMPLVRFVWVTFDCIFEFLRTFGFNSVPGLHLDRIPTMRPSTCIWVLIVSWWNQSDHLGLGSVWPSVCHPGYQKHSHPTWPTLIFIFILHCQMDDCVSFWLFI